MDTKQKLLRCSGLSNLCAVLIIRCCLFIGTTTATERSVIDFTYQ